MGQSPARAHGMSLDCLALAVGLAPMVGGGRVVVRFSGALLEES